jgi:bifunctional non-homologous end joining protein LigD
VVIGGWRLEVDSDRRLGAVLVGTPAGNGSGGLRYLGRVGSGLAGKEQERVLAALHDLRTTGSPFAEEVPAVDALGTIWVRPEIVVEVEALGVSAQGRLRQPAYRGMRPDLSPDDLYEEG